MTQRIAALTVLTLTLPLVPAFASDEALATAPVVASAPARPAVLPVLYASYAALQAYDVYSTRQALSRGAREANPLMQQVVGSQSAFWAVKASVTVGAIAAAERLWKQNRKSAAVAVLVASNAVAAIVAARNANTLRR